MKIRTRKFIGTIILVFFITIYALAAMELGAARFTDVSILIQSLYFAVAGFLWILPAGLIVRWMQRSD